MIQPADEPTIMATDEQYEDACHRLVMAVRRGNAREATMLDLRDGRAGRDHVSEAEKYIEAQKEIRDAREAVETMRAVRWALDRRPDHQ